MNYAWTDSNNHHEVNELLSRQIDRSVYQLACDRLEKTRSVYEGEISFSHANKV